MGIVEAFQTRDDGDSGWGSVSGGVGNGQGFLMNWIWRVTARRE